METARYTLGDILSRLDDSALDATLFLNGAWPWNANSQGAVLVIQEEEAVEIEATLQKNEGLKKALNIEVVWQIVAYARAELPNVNVNQLVDSFNWYYKHDGFLSLTEFSK